MQSERPSVPLCINYEYERQQKHLFPANCVIVPSLGIRRDLFPSYIFSIKERESKQKEKSLNISRF